MRAKVAWSIGASLILSLVILQNAWVSDDGFITLRVVENVVAGYGPLFNIGERVQVFTHPLWMLLLSGAYYLLLHVPAFHALGLPLYGLTIWAGLLLSLFASVLFFWRIVPRWQVALCSLLILGLSRSFIHYSTSGLENPLTHLILTAALAVILGFTQNTALITLLAGLAILTRWELALVFAPYLLFLLAVSANRIRTLQEMLLGLLPVLGWLGFSVLYYGFAWPNTAYAKLATGFERGTLLQEGWLYFEDLWVHDRLTFVVILVGIVVSLAARDWKRRTLGSGIVIYLAFLWWRGGDFMSGRLFSPVLILTLGLLASRDWKTPRTYHWAALTVLVAGLSVPHPPFFPDARIGVAPRSAFVYKGQVTDERAYYYARTGLLSPGKYYLKRQWPRPDPWRADPAAYEVRQLNDLGIKGYSAGPSVHVVDAYALADPLLARLPAYPEWSSIGHAARLLPDGYLPSLQARQNRIVNPDLAEYYERLRLVVSGGIFDPARLKEIGRFAFGQNQPLLDAYVQAQAPPGD